MSICLESHNDMGLLKPKLDVKSRESNDIMNFR